MIHATTTPILLKLLLTLIQFFLITPYHIIQQSLLITWFFVAVGKFMGPANGVGLYPSILRDEVS